MTRAAVTAAIQASWRDVRAWARKNSYPLIVSSVGFLLISVYFIDRIFVTIPPGHGGVLWERLFGGTVTDRMFGEGLHIIMPFNRMYAYDTRLQQVTETYDAISSDGLVMAVEVSVRFRLVESNVGYLHKFIGPTYITKLITPEVASQVRSVISSYTPEDLYSKKRQKIQKEIFELVSRELETTYDPDQPARRFVVVETVLIRNVSIPTRVKNAIESKIEQFHKMLEYDYRIQRQAKESIRLHIEAEGIRKFQEVVSNGLTQDLLTWKGIEATLALAQSNNSKVVVVGSPKNGLPIILNTDQPTRATPRSGEASVPSEAEEHKARASDLDALRDDNPEPAKPQTPEKPVDSAPVTKAPLPTSSSTGLPKSLEEMVDRLSQSPIAKSAQ